MTIVPHKWEVEVVETTATVILKRDGTPVARFYAQRMSLHECRAMAAKLNQAERAK